MEKISQERLELALKASNEGIWDWEVVGGGEDVLFFSDKTLEFFGCEEGEIPGLFDSPKDWVHEEDLDGYLLSVREVLEDHGNDTLAIDCRFKVKNGDWVWLRVRGVAVRKEGKLKRLAGSVIDISRRKRVEAALEEERHQLKTLIENVPMSIYFKDLESRFVMVNTPTAKKLGCTKVDEVIGKTDHDFFDKRHADQSRKEEETVVATGKPQRESVEQEVWEDKDDTWVITTKIPWIDKEGKIRGVFGVSNDVTNLVLSQRKLMEMTLRMRDQNKEIKEELQLASEIQLSMIAENQITRMPQADTEECWNAYFSYKYVPVSGMAGDFFQVIPITEHQVGVLMCDVMGHGVRSALIVSMLRGLLEKEMEFAAEPDKILQGLNKGLVSIFKRAGVTMFSTAFYGVLDLKAGTLSYSNAGHPSPILLNGSEVKRLSDHGKVTGPALGMIPNCKYVSKQISFEKFSKMVIFTDGIYETEDKEGEELGVTGMMPGLKADGEIGEDLDRIMELTKTFSANGEFGDDVCLLGIKLAESE